MIKRILLALLAVLSIAFYLEAQQQQQGDRRQAPQTQRKRGLIRNEPGAFEGYTLFTPISSTETYLIDMEGRVVNKWESDFPPGQSVYLLENGHLLRTARYNNPGQQRFNAGGAGGRVQEFTWDGELVWDYVYAGEGRLLHHDIAAMPNGNVLMIAWELKTPREAVDAGRNPDKIGPESLWADHVIEVKPTGKTTGEIVWEWHVWDHLVQERDPDLANYGKVDEHPELIHINHRDWTERLAQEDRKDFEKLKALGYLGAATTKKSNPDWNHTNSIAYNAALDQIVLSIHGFDEIWVIDHSTTTKEAAGHEGGRSGKGGDLLYRWGNPLAYGAGMPEDQQLFAQHDAYWIPDELPGAGNILIFNNGRGRPGGHFSTVDEIVTPVDERGRYALEKGGAFGPAKPVWTYAAPDESDFFDSHISGAQRLPNGNTLICSGESGTFFEVTAEGKMVWEYVNPAFGDARPPGGGMGRGGDGPGRRGPRGGFRPGRGGPPGGDSRRMGGRGPGGMGPMGPGPKNLVFKVRRYAPDYPGLAGRELKPGKTVEELTDAAKASSALDAPGARGTKGGGRSSDSGKPVPSSAEVVKLAGDMRFTEGPVWVPEKNCLLFSDIPADAIMMWKAGKLSEFRKPSRNTNGNLLDPEGRLLSCEHGSRTVTRTARDGKVETIAADFEGKKFNSPNDLAVRSDGTIWFTDPPYGLKDRAKELDGNFVFCLRPASGELKIVASDFDRPNGLCLSPFEQKLYIADSGKPRHIRVFDVKPDGSLENGMVFCTIDSGVPDGIRCDGKGRIWSSAGDGVHVFSPEGKLLQKIPVPERPANLCFGGPDGKTLFITARTSLYKIEL